MHLLAFAVPLLAFDCSEQESRLQPTVLLAGLPASVVWPHWRWQGAAQGNWEPGSESSAGGARESRFLHQQ